MLPPDIAQKLRVDEGDLVELVAGTGPLVRGWARIGETGGDAPVMIGASAFDLLKAAPGGYAEIRRVESSPAE